MDTLAIAGDTFAQLIGGMSTRLQQANLALLYFFSVVAFAVLCIGIMNESKQLLAHGVMFLLVAGVLLAIGQSIQPLGSALMEAAVALGLRAGGSGQNASAFVSSPDAIYYAGLAHTQNIYEVANQVCGVFQYKCGGLNLPALPLYIAAWAIFLVFALAAVMLFVCLMFFQIGVALALVTLPMAMWGVTREFGTAPLRYAFHGLTQLFSLSMVISFSNLWVAQVVHLTEPSVFTAIGIIVVALGVFILLVVSGIFTKMMTGSGIISFAAVAAPVMTALVFSKLASRMVAQGGKTTIELAKTKPVRAIASGTSKAAMMAVRGFTVGGKMASGRGKTHPLPNRETGSTPKNKENMKSW